MFVLHHFHYTQNTTDEFGNSPESYFYSIATIVGLIVVMFFYAKWTKHRFNFRKEFLLLTAYILKSDSNVTAKELNYVEAFLKKEFGEDEFDKNKKKLLQYLKYDNSIDKAFKRINITQNFATKLQLLHFLVCITIVDGYLSNREYLALNTVAQSLGLKQKQLDSVLAMHDNFITEKAHKEESRDSKKHRSFYQLKKAYSVLGLSEFASSKEIKKSYRELVVLYHPDKLLGLEEIYKKDAKVNYQKINDAYELLKDELGFK